MRAPCPRKARVSCLPSQRRLRAACGDRDGGLVALPVVFGPRIARFVIAGDFLRFALLGLFRLRVRDYEADVRIILPFVGTTHDLSIGRALLPCLIRIDEDLDDRPVWTRD